MNLAAIKGCCADTKIASVVTGPSGDQWISNVVALYLVSGIRISEEAIPELFNLNDKQIGKWTINERESTDPWLDAYPRDDDIQLEEIGRVMLYDETLVALSGKAGMVLINARYVKPVRTAYRRYFMRTLADGMPIVAVFDDVMCTALVLPISAYGNRQIQELAERIAGTPWAVPTDDGADAEAAAEKIAAEMGVGEK